ncbi:ParB/RepB/Spo0J family partition protein [Chelativorans sp. ZYF759]|uniref:ParB/RepB/Spo0J family partition protein n=1 Tax=Chelativorans sp. ZYF759 TaxID=2692213 RepID=UPI00145D89A9|nr:ParB/RepB/Spo0J family partition protein [Chelativorans sp. ZYF759]NMG40387.1 ParB/RepB/Spo0J family partition protein [Chelativorans sp. ZYF759]
MKMTTEKFRKMWGKTSLVAPNAVKVGKRLRPVRKDDEFKALMASLEEHGQQAPIIVREDWPDDRDGEWMPTRVLVAGARRLEAAKALGWERVEAIVHINMSDDEAEAIEIVENLHRQELTSAERKEQVKRLLELQSPSGVETATHVAVSNKGGRGKKGVAAKVAEATGLSVRQVQRIQKEMKPEPEASNVVPLRLPADTASVPAVKRGPKVESTTGISLIDAAIKGLEMEEAGERIADIAKAVGLQPDRYRDARDVALIHGIEYLTPHHRKVADEALNVLGEGYLTEARAMVDHIANLLWDPTAKGNRRKAIEENQGEFLRIMSVADTLSDLLERHGVPYLDPERRLDAAEYLSRVRKEVAETVNRMREVNGSQPFPAASADNYQEWAAEMNRVWSRAPEQWRAKWLATSRNVG